MSQPSAHENEPLHDEPTRQTQRISTFRRLAPQILVAITKNLISFNKSLFDGLSSVVIPALIGIAVAQNPHEKIQIIASHASWLSTCTFIGHPFGSLISGFLSDELGRRKALMYIVAPAVITFICLSFASSFGLICVYFFLLSFIFGLKDAPATVYVSETSEPSIRGTLLSLSTIAKNSGIFVVYLLGSFLSWRQVALACSIVPIIIIIAICFIPESPNWLLSKDRPKDAQRSLQWLRGWVEPATVHDEFTKLQDHIQLVNACSACAKQRITCPHPTPSFFDKIKELKQKRNMKPFVLVMALNVLLEFSGAICWRPYIIQVIKAHGIPVNVHTVAMILSSTSIAGGVCFLLCVKMFGKRRLYLSSTAIVVVCCIGLGIYGNIFFPPNWTSFKNPNDSSVPNFQLIQNIVGNYGHLAFALMFFMYFFTSVGLYAVPTLIHAEVFPFKLRSFLTGVTLALRYLIAAISTKLYYNIEIWLTLSGAILFYGIVSLIGLIVMYFILPETENRSLEDIERHYSDDTKKITDIHIRINNKNNRNINKTIE